MGLISGLEGSTCMPKPPGSDFRGMVLALLLVTVGLVGTGGAGLLSLTKFPVTSCPSLSCFNSLPDSS